MKHLLLILILSLFVSSCDRLAPARFWLDFDKDLIVKKESDQGPWGGYRYIHWKSEEPGTFSAGSIVSYAVENDWEITDTLSYDEAYTLMIPASYKSTDYSFDILEKEVMKRIELSDDSIFVFKTGYIAIEPGNSRDTYKNGFVIKNSDGTELIVYHLWGE